MTTHLTDDGYYVYQERLGILCGDETPTPYQHQIALTDALECERGSAPDEPRPHAVTAPRSPILPAQ